jgi:hypothetical protein
MRIGLRETVWEVVDWIHLARDRVQGISIEYAVMNLRVP